MSVPELEKVDPSIELQRGFARIAKGTTAHIKKMRQDVIYSDGALPSKIKVLGALLWSISARCEPCVAGYASQAKKYGVTEEELGEVLALASTMGGCVGETWALKAYKTFKVRDFTKRSHPISFERDQCLRVPSERQRRVYFRSDFLSTDFADSDRYPGPRRMMVLALG